MSFFCFVFFYLENDPVLTVLFPRFSFYIFQLLLIGFLPSVCASHFKKTLEYILNFFCFISFTETGIFWHFLNTISCKDVRLDQWYTSWKGFSGLSFKEVFGDTINLLLAFLFFKFYLLVKKKKKDSDLFLMCLKLDFRVISVFAVRVMKMFHFAV